MKRVIVSNEIERLVDLVCRGAFAVHRTLGPGLLESAYHECMAIELRCAGLSVEREKLVPIVYRGQTIPHAYRLDLIIEGKLLVELKAVTAIDPVHKVQVVTYLKLLRLPLGLLINFNVPLIKDGINRVLNLEFQTEAPPAPASPLFPASPRLRV
jgi:GxxExxY protein